MSKRAYGSGELYVRPDAAGSESWYGRWYSGGVRVKRRIGPVRQRSSQKGLTRKQAERELRRRIEAEKVIVRSGLAFEEVGRHYIDHLEFVLERKPSTVGDYRSILRAHAIPHFGEECPLERIGPDQVASYITAKKREGKATKTITNHLIFLHGVFAYAVKKRWIASNPVAAVDRPRAPESDPDIRYLDLAELDALLAAVPDDELGRMEGSLYLVAAMTGLRQGELLALRRCDIDWRASLVRVRRNYTRQQFGKPKSKRSSRAVPMADRVSAALSAHFHSSAYRADDDLVFCHPQSGRPYDASKLRKRFKQTVVRAGLREIRFHDLRHTFGTHCAAEGVPSRTLQEWMGHRSIKTTEIYADYAPRPQESRFVERAFDRSHVVSQGPSAATAHEPPTEHVPLPELVGSA